MSADLSASDLLQRAEALSRTLSDAGIWNEIRVFRQDGLTVLARVPGQFWEIDLLADGMTDVEVLRSTGPMEDETAIARLISDFGEPQTGSKQRMPFKSPPGDAEPAT